MSSLRSVAGLALVIACTGPAGAENVLRWGGPGSVFGFDPHTRDNTGEVLLSDPVYESLIGVDSDMTISGHLAVTWKALDPTTWEFELRQGVRFHDGTPFTAEDVVFSINRARAEPSGFKYHLENLSRIEAIDDHTVHIITAMPESLIWYMLSYIKIMSKAWAEHHAVTIPANYDEQEETYAVRHANGTGPFILESFDPDGHTVMVRNPDWWGYDKYPHNINRLVRLPIADTEEGVDALLDGEIDFLYATPANALDQIERTPGLKLAETTAFVTYFLAFDLKSEKLRSSNMKGRNPFQDKRVRQALYHAIDIQALINQVLGGLAIPAGMLVAPGVNGHTPELARRPPYDAGRAKALLADAGYPEGFHVRLDCPNDWSQLQGEAVCRALAAQLRNVGIEVALGFQPQTAFQANWDRDFYMRGWYQAFDSWEALQAMFHSQGHRNKNGYANPKVDELIDIIQREMVTYIRDAKLEEIWRIVIDDLVYVPLYHPIIVWPMREELELPADPVNLPHFREARFK